MILADATTTAASTLIVGSLAAIIGAIAGVLTPIFAARQKKREADREDRRMTVDEFKAIIAEQKEQIGGLRTQMAEERARCESDLDELRERVADLERRPST